MQTFSDKQIVEMLSNKTFECQRCSRCCRKEPGIVMLTVEDFEKARKNLNMGVEEFIKECCKEVYKDGLVFVGLKEKKNYDCIFWSNGCLIYEDRPLQCKTFPYWPYLVEYPEFWAAEKKRCPGLGKKDTLTIDEKKAFYLAEKNAVYMQMPGTF